MNGHGDTLKVLLVDDHPIVRVGCRTLLETDPGIEIVAEVGSGQAAYRVFIECEPDIVITELRLPGIGGLEAIRRIVLRKADANILVYSMHEDPAYAEQALNAGARGYVGKSSTPAVLIGAVKQLATGSMYLDPDIAQRLALTKIRRVGTPFSRLSTREFEIFRLLAEGFSVSDIAARLSLSNKTIANYTTRIKGKLETDTVAELARLAIRHGLVEA